MPTNVIPAGVFTDPVTRPVDGEPVNAATWQPSIQALTDRTDFIVQQVGGPDGSSNWEYANPRLRYKIVTLAKAMLTQTVGGAELWRKQLLSNGIHFIPTDDAVIAVLDLEPAHLSTIETIEVWLSTSSSRGTAGDRWQISLWRQGVDDSGPFAEVSGVQQGATVDDNGADGYTKLTLTHSLAVDRQNYTYTLRVRGPNSVASGDFAHLVRIGFGATTPEGGF